MRYFGVLASGFIVGVLAEKAGLNPYQAIIFGLINTVFVNQDRDFKTFS